jgi:hypothetical protein
MMYLTIKKQVKTQNQDILFFVTFRKIFLMQIVKSEDSLIVSCNGYHTKPCLSSLQTYSFDFRPRRRRYRPSKILVKKLSTLSTVDSGWDVMDSSREYWDSNCGTHYSRDHRDTNYNRDYSDTNYNREYKDTKINTVIYQALLCYFCCN